MTIETERGLHRTRIRTGAGTPFPFPVGAFALPGHFATALYRPMQEHREGTPEKSDFSGPVYHRLVPFTCPPPRQSSGELPSLAAPRGVAFTRDIRSFANRRWAS